jgi:hypothetical protein
MPARSYTGGSRRRFGIQHVWSGKRCHEETPIPWCGRRVR